MHPVIILPLEELSRNDLTWLKLSIKRKDWFVWSLTGGAWIYVDLTRRWRVRSSFVASGRHLNEGTGDFNRWDCTVENQRQGRVARFH
jgi:hypothetical protein